MFIVDNDMDQEMFDQSKLQDFLIELKPTPFNMLCQEAGSIAVAISDQEKLPRIYFSESANGEPVYNEIISDGVRISINDLRYFCDRMFIICSFECEELMCNFRHFPDICSMRDSMHNSTPGFWFGQELEKKINKKFVQHLFVNTNFKSHWFTVTGKLKSTAATQYLAKLQTFLVHLVILIHVSSGAPPRATETVRCLIRNQTNCKRTIFLQEGYFCIIQRYCKTRGRSQRDTFIARFLTPDISALLYKYLVVIRCFTIFLLQELELNLEASHELDESTDDEDSEDQSSLMILGTKTLPQIAADFLCWNRQGPMSSSFFRTSFRRSFKEILKIDITFSAYRQISGAFVDKLIVPNLSNQDQLLPFAAQTGHTHDTAMKWYGLSNVDHPAMSRDRFDAFKLCSRYWQGLLKLTGGYEVIKNSDNSNTELSRSISHDKRISGTPNPGETTLDVGIWDQVITFFTKIAGSALPRHSNVLDTFSFNSDHATDLKALKEISDSARSIYGANFNWRVPEQMTAAVMLQSMANHRKDGIIIMPTGSGKSLLFMLRAKINANLKSPKVVVVVVPLRSILLNMSNRLNVSYQCRTNESSGPMWITYFSQKILMLVISLDVH